MQNVKKKMKRWDSYGTFWIAYEFFISQHQHWSPACLIRSVSFVYAKHATHCFLFSFLFSFHRPWNLHEPIFFLFFQLYIVYCCIYPKICSMYLKVDLEKENKLNTWNQIEEILYFPFFSNYRVIFYVMHSCQLKWVILLKLYHSKRTWKFSLFCWLFACTWQKGFLPSQFTLN